VTGAFLSDQIAELLERWHLASPQNPFELLTPRTTNAELLVASQQLLLTLIILYGSYFALIIPIDAKNRLTLSYFERHNRPRNKIQAPENRPPDKDSVSIRYCLTTKLVA
jgi:hypothetical protein